jgi:hypothetical protein
MIFMTSLKNLLKPQVFHHLEFLGYEAGIPINLLGGGLGFPLTLNLGANCMFSKFKNKIQDKFYPTEVVVYSKHVRRTVF